MSNDNNYDVIDDKQEFRFIQEQIIPKEQSKFIKVVYIVVKTMVLGLIFGLASSVIFCISYPYIKRAVNNESDNSLSFAQSVPNISIGLAKLVPAYVADQHTIQEPIIIENTVQANLQDYQNMYSLLNDIVTEVNNSIVSVTGIVNSVDWLQNPYETSDVTSGVIIAETKSKGILHILVRYSKIKDVNRIQVSFGEDSVVEARLSNYDSSLDLAIINADVTKIPDKVKKKIRVATLGESYVIAPGDPVIAVGNPNGYPYARNYGIITNKMTSAYITDNRIDLFNTSIDDNTKGDGVIVNLKGEVIGIITHNFKKDLNANINTVIGISRIKLIIDDLVKNKQRTYLGVVGTDITEDIGQSLGVTKGVYINEVETDSPALEAGIQTGDVITKIGDSEISSMSQLNSVISSYQPEDTVTITVKRTTNQDKKKQNMNIQVQLQKKKK
ncbi:MAG TPA: PDZ domain-containing protein [Lachnospiraceae bacterium]|nr:PDZ domain-containing protein [Lachnospiraceae bacterium]